MASLSSLWRAFPRRRANGATGRAAGRAAGKADLLAEYRGAATDAEAERLLGELIAERVAPVVRAALRQRQVDADAAEAAFGAVTATVLERLRRERQATTDSRLPPITHLEGYIAAVTRHNIDSDLRERFPERARLRRSLRYVLTHAPGLALWRQTVDGARVCGKSTWRDAGLPAIALTGEELARRAEPVEGSARLVGLPLVLHDAAGVPLLDDTLVAAAALLRGADATAPVTLAEFGAEEPATGETLEAALLRRAELEQVWAEVRLLPPRQCAALLLNLRDTEDRGVLELLLALGLARRDDIAAALGWTGTQLDAVWEELPLEDNRIADLLGVTRQQVINLRKVARERLQRRTCGAAESEGES
jgi:hypothetical protein